MKISELPEDVKQKALRYQREEKDSYFNKGTNLLNMAFNWCDTTEGSEYWIGWFEKSAESPEQGVATLKRASFEKPKFSDAIEEKEAEILKEKEYDHINPDHYKQNSIEVIDMMLRIWGPEKLITYCEITAFKYRMRLGSKPDQPIERDYEKAQWYEAKAKEIKNQIK